MTEIVIYVLIAVLLLAAGSGFGFWLGQRRGRQDAAKSTRVQEEFAAYRNQVAEHFGETAGHFQALGTQVRRLYDHMAAGADMLCDEDAAGRRIEFSAAAPLSQPVDYEQPGDASTVIEDDLEAATETAAPGDDDVEIQTEQQSAAADASATETGEEAAEASPTEALVEGEGDQTLKEPGSGALAGSVTTGTADDEEATKRAYH